MREEAKLKAKIKDLEKEIRRLKKKPEEEQFKKLFEFAPDPYYLSDLKGNFIDGNKAAEKVIGYKKEELIGKSFLKLGLIPKSQIPKATALLAKNLLGKPTGPDEFTLNRRDDKKVILEVSTRPIKIRGKIVVLGIARDVSNRKRLEKDLMIRNRQLRKFNKLAVGRELKMVELKEEIKKLSKKLEDFQE